MAKAANQKKQVDDDDKDDWDSFPVVVGLRVKPNPGKRPTCLTVDAANKSVTLGRSNRVAKEDGHKAKLTFGDRFSVGTSSWKEYLSRETHLRLSTTESFNHVFPESASQGAVYRNLVAQFVDLVLVGYDLTLISYGQSGAGKTHSLYGSDLALTTVNRDELGIVLLLLNDVFCHLNSDDDMIKISFVEIEDDEERDLLSDNLLLTTDEPPLMSESHIVNNLSTPSVTSHGDSGSFVQCNRIDEVIRCLDKGLSRRKRYGGSLDASFEDHFDGVTSAKGSHSVLTVIVNHSDASKGLTYQSHIKVVDLVGCEKVAVTVHDSGESDQMVLNRGLLNLDHIIRSDDQLGSSATLFSRENLTRHLWDSIGGKTLTVLLCCVSSLEEDMSNTEAAIQFSVRMSKIRNHPKQNVFTASSKTCGDDGRAARACMGSALPLSPSQSAVNAVNSNVALYYWLQYWKLQEALQQQYLSGFHQHLLSTNLGFNQYLQMPSASPSATNVTSPVLPTMENITGMDKPPPGPGLSNFVTQQPFLPVNFPWDCTVGVSGRNLNVPVANGCDQTPPPVRLCVQDPEAVTQQQHANQGEQKVGKGNGFPMQTLASIVEESEHSSSLISHLNVVDDNYSDSSDSCLESFDSECSDDSSKESPDMSVKELIRKFNEETAKMVENFHASLDLGSFKKEKIEVECDKSSPLIEVTPRGHEEMSCRTDQLEDRVKSLEHKEKAVQNLENEFLLKEKCHMDQQEVVPPKSAEPQKLRECFESHRQDEHNVEAMPRSKLEEGNLIFGASASPACMRGGYPALRSVQQSLYRHKEVLETKRQLDSRYVVDGKVLDLPAVIHRLDVAVREKVWLRDKSINKADSLKIKGVMLEIVKTAKKLLEDRKEAEERRNADPLVNNNELQEIKEVNVVIDYLSRVILRKSLLCFDFETSSERSKAKEVLSATKTRLQALHEEVNNTDHQTRNQTQRIAIDEIIDYLSAVFEHKDILIRDQNICFKLDDKYRDLEGYVWSILRNLSPEESQMSHLWLASKVFDYRHRLEDADEEMKKLDRELDWVKQQWHETEKTLKKVKRINRDLTTFYRRCVCSGGGPVKSDKH